MAGVTRAAIDSMDVVDHIFIAVEVAAYTIGGGIYLASMIVGLGVSGKGCGNRAVTIIAVAGGPRLTFSGRPLGARERGNQCRWREVTVGAIAGMRSGNNVRFVMATGAGGAKVGDKGVIGVGWAEAKRGGVAWNARYGVIVGCCGVPGVGRGGSVRLQTVFGIIFGLGVTDLADTLGWAGDRVGGTANDVVIVRD